jgi:transposase-like protein
MYTILTLKDFQQQFPTEDACFEFFSSLRWPHGFRCPACGKEQYYFLPRKRRFQCKACGRQTSVTAGTVFHRLRHPFSVLVWALYLVATTKKGISAMELQRKLGIRCYESAWLLLQKIRQAMSPHGHFKLTGEVEVDETFVGGSREGKRGRGAEGKTLVAIAVETDGKTMGRARLNRIESSTREELHGFIQSQVAPGALVHTDGLNSYGKLNAYQHKPRKKSKENPDVLPRVHIVVANLKMWLRGTYNRLPSKHLQRYMDEFTFRFNRRWKLSAIFSILAYRCLTTPTITFADLTR